MSDVAREVPLIWAVSLAALGYGAAVTLAVVRTPAPATMAGGMRVGAVVGLLMWLTALLTLQATGAVLANGG